MSLTTAPRKTSTALVDAAAQTGSALKELFKITLKVIATIVAILFLIGLIRMGFLYAEYGGHADTQSAPAAPALVKVVNTHINLVV